MELLYGTLKLPQDLKRTGYSFYHQMIPDMKLIALRVGGWMFIGFLCFFLAMHMLHWSQNYFLRYFNGVIHGAGLWIALREWIGEDPENRHDEYPSGVALGMLTTLAAVVPFAVFMTIFLAYSPAFMADIQRQTPIGQYFNPVTASAFILMEGIAGGLIGSYVVMRIQEAMRQPV